MSASNTHSQNPLLHDVFLPPFTEISAESVVPAITQLIADNREALQTLLAEVQSAGAPRWQTLVAPFEEREDRLSKAFSPVSHLNAVMNSAALRDAYNQAIQQLTEYNSELGQNRALCDAYQNIKASTEFATLSKPQQKTIDNALRDFHLAGVDLPPAQQARFKTIQKRLSELSTTFANNVLDATQGWYLHVQNAGELAGIPDTAQATAQQAAASKQLSGWVFTLDGPAYLAIMTHADTRALRQTMYRAYVTRASAEGVAVGDKNPSAWDNSALIAETLALRHELAQLLGYNNFAERSLATKMASSTDEVINFLNDLATKAKPGAENELAELQAFAAQHYGVTLLEPWDIAYYSEKQREAVYAISQEQLRPYFPAAKVLDGLFAIVGRLFDVQFMQDSAVNTWHPDAHFYWVTRGGEKIAAFYLDLYARENKRGGAWMGDCRVRRSTKQGLQLPVAYLTCNFSAPSAAIPSLLTHNEVTTLFHEFGHGLHHMLTAIDCPAVSGINGVAWDAVELPSQFMENWCWEKAAIPLISAHYQTGEPLPDAMLEKLLAAKNYQSAMQTVRQIEFALFDFRLHLEYNPAHPQDPQQLLNAVRQQVAVLIPPAFNKFQNSFTHIFAGGYAAGYYSYKWAEVLSADAFSLFEEQGIFDKATAQKYLHEILERGGSDDAMALFVNFRGRKPSIEPLLRHNGIEVRHNGIEVRHNGIAVRHNEKKG